MAKLKYLLLTATAASVSAFSFQNPTQGLVSLDESLQREMYVYPMLDWATNCGVQTSPGFQLAPTGEQQDFCAITQEDLPAGSPVLFVPNEMILSDGKAAEEFSSQLAEAENELFNADLGKKIRLFRLFIKILVEYEKGEQSPWYPWLNSLPRLYNTGSSMTYACFDCLPAYAGWLALSERKHFVNFQKAVMFVPGLNEDIKENVEVLKWAYNVALTRSFPWQGQRLIAPMADMFNHAADPEVEINYDEQGNCMAYTCKDVPAGFPLRISYGDPTNPSPLLATYGFLATDCAASFFKGMHLRPEMEELGYDFSDLLFYKDTGDVSLEVYDVQLYSILKKNDPNLANEFYQAVMNDKANMHSGESQKMQYHQHYSQFTKDELLKHVDRTLRDLDKLSNKAQSYNIQTHPRVPIILQHNAFVKETFMRVKQNLENM